MAEKELKLPKDEVKRIETETTETAGDRAGDHQISDDEKKLVELAVKQYGDYFDFYDEEITKAKDDIRFVGGDHWTIDSVDVAAERKKQGRLSLVKNRAPGFIDTVTGEVRQNMPRLKFRPVDSKTDPKLADIYNAAMSYTMSVSQAHRQIIPAFEQACTGGYPGWLHLVTDYVDEEKSDEQELYIRFIPGQFGPALDHTATTFDESKKGGPKWGMVPEKISWAEYTERFPKASTKSWEMVKDSGNSWFSENGLTICSYYRAVPVWKKAAGRKKEILSYRIDHYLINGCEVLEGPEPWIGKFIPIIPVEGKWFMDNGKKRYRSVYREAKDTNRMENWTSSETIELLADEPYIADPEMIADEHREQWQDHGKKKYGVLFAKTVNGLLPRKEDNSQKIAALFKMSPQFIDDGKALTGIFNASRGEASNETSRVAINARDAQSGKTNFAFVDNGIVAAMEYIGLQFIDAFPRVFDYEKTLKIIGEDDREEGDVTLNATEPGMGEGVEPRTVHVIKDKYGEIVKKLYTDLADVRFNIVVDVGPGFKTQRMEALDSLVRMSQGNQIFAEASSGQVAKMLDIQDSDKIAARSEFILSQKYPGIDHAGEDNGPGNKTQLAVKQAVKQFQDSIAPQLEQSAQAMEQQQQKIQELEAALRDKEEKLKVAALAMSNKAFDIKSGITKEEIKGAVALEIARMKQEIPDVSTETQELQAQIAAIAQAIEALTTKNSIPAGGEVQ